MAYLQELTALLIGAALLYVSQFITRKVVAKRRMKQAQKYLSEDLKDFEIVPIYEMTDEKGKPVKFYAFANPLKLPAARAISGEVAMKQAEMNIDRSALLEFVAAMKEAANAGQITTMFANLENLEQRVNFACEEETLLSLACAYFLLEGEDPRTTSEAIQVRKRELMKSSDEARAFFLTSAWKLTSEFSDISGSDILNYLKEVKEAIRRPSVKRPQRSSSSVKLASSSTQSTSKTSGSAGRALPKKKS